MRICGIREVHKDVKTELKMIVESDGVRPRPLHLLLFSAKLCRCRGDALLRMSGNARLHPENLVYRFLGCISDDNHFAIALLHSYIFI